MSNIYSLSHYIENIIYIFAEFLSPKRINKIFKTHSCQYRRNTYALIKIVCNFFNRQLYSAYSLFTIGFVRKFSSFKYPPFFLPCEFASWLGLAGLHQTAIKFCFQQQNLATIGRLDSDPLHMCSFWIHGVRGREEVFIMLKTETSVGKSKILSTFQVPTCITSIDITFSRQLTRVSMVVSTYLKIKASHMVKSNTMPFF